LDVVDISSSKCRDLNTVKLNKGCKLFHSELS